MNTLLRDGLFCCCAGRKITGKTKQQQQNFALQCAMVWRRLSRVKGENIQRVLTRPRSCLVFGADFSCFDSLLSEVKVPVLLTDDHQTDFYFGFVFFLILQIQTNYHCVQHLISLIGLVHLVNCLRSVCLEFEPSHSHALKNVNKINYSQKC